MGEDVEVRLRLSMPEANALLRLLKGHPASSGDNDRLDRVAMHVGSVLGTLRKHPPKVS